MTSFRTEEGQHCLCTALATRAHTHGSVCVCVCVCACAWGGGGWLKGEPASRSPMGLGEVEGVGMSDISSLV